VLIPAIESHESSWDARHAWSRVTQPSTRPPMKRKRTKRRQACLRSNRSTKSAERKREQRKRWFKQGQKWRTGCEGRISVLKRRHGLRRCLYKGDAGMKRWVGLGVIADNLIHMGDAQAEG